MNDKVKYLPGINPDAGGDKKLTVEAVVQDLLEKKPKEVTVVAVLEDGSVMVTGNSTIASGVYLLELGKLIIMEKTAS